MTYVPPMERTAMRAAHKAISDFARRGLYAKAELRLLNAPEEYQAVIALCKYTVRLRYTVTPRLEARAAEQAKANDAHGSRVLQQIRRAPYLVPPLPAVMQGGAS